jgi:GDP-6-deoxy-D-talose 4-dehydrogenase
LKILVTGARGFTGRHFVSTARAAGHDVTPLGADLLDPPALTAEVAASRPDAIVHLAAISFVGHPEPKAFYDVNLFGTLALLDAAQAVSTSTKLLIASSGNVYGNSSEALLTESSPIAPVNHYAMSKAAMEFMVRAKAPQLPLIITRPFNYTGVGQPTDFVIPKLIDHFLRKASVVELGNLHVEREYNDVRFVAQAYLRLIEQDVAPGTYNVCTGSTHDLASIIDKLQHITGHIIKVEVNPRFVRPNEIRKLCGSPYALRRSLGQLPQYSLEETLSWMLTTTA